MRALYLIALCVFGACLGSFLCCQARRLHLRGQGKRLGRRSVCLHCGRQLKWYDNIPILSWLVLRGRCRYCHARIGRLELLAELGLALAFLCLGLNFDFSSSDPLVWGNFLLVLVLTCLLGFLAIYDGAYGELPTAVLTISISCAIMIATLKIWAGFLAGGWTAGLVLEPLGAVAVLGGVYLILYVVSKGGWVGDGDWLLGLALGLALGNTWLALLTLCLANLLACVVGVPLLLKSNRTGGTSRAKPLGRAKRVDRTGQSGQSDRVGQANRALERTSRSGRSKKVAASRAAAKISLGPFLISAFVIIYAGQNFFLNLV